MFHMSPSPQTAQQQAWAQQQAGSWSSATRLRAPSPMEVIDGGLSELVELEFMNMIIY